MTERSELELAQAHRDLSRFFGDKVWTTSVLRRCQPEGECMKNGCLLPAVMRIRLNIWGNAHEYDVCEQHGTHNGETRDGHWVDGL